MQRLLHGFIFPLAAGLVVGCTRSEPAEAGGAALPPPGSGDQYEVRLPQPPPKEAAEIQLDLDPSLDGCDLLHTHFPYDESTALPQDHVELRAIAACLNAPPYENSSLLLIGRADERGPTEYNERLGRQRAKYVKEVLTDFGVDADRISTTTEGEAKAKGSRPEYSHGYDRRVDVVHLMVQAPR